jgi:hypothetical protein
MRLVRPGIVGAAVLLALHIFMLAGIDIGHPSPAAITVTLHHGEAQDAAAVAPSTRGHSMAVACLAVLAGLLLWDMPSAVTQRRLQPLDVTPPAAPVRKPPTPPPVALGISRT